MELFYFISGVLVSIVSVMIYNYSKLNSNVKLLLKNNEILAKRNADHNLTIDYIKSTLSSDNYQTTKDLVSKLKGIENEIKIFEQSLNTLAKKSNNDFDKMTNSVQELKSYVKEFTNQSTSNRGY
jgi:vacuolar-type H+-ATPase subunit I/STV1